MYINNQCRFFLSTTLYLLALSFSSSNTLAVTSSTWVSGNGNYLDAGNWNTDPTIPLNDITTSYDVFIENGSIVTYSNAVPALDAIDSLTLTNSQFIVSGSNSNFSVLSSYSAIGSTLIAQDSASLMLSGSSASIDQSTLIARKTLFGTGNAQLLINASSYTGTTGNFQSREFTADGPGTLLDMSALSSLTRSSGLGNTLTIRALNGGTLDMSSLSSFTDNVSGNGGLSVSAAGAGSTVDISGITDVNAMTVSATTGGVVSGQLQTALNSTIIRGGDGSVLDVSQLTDVTDSTVISQDGGTMSLLANDIDHSSLIARKTLFGTGNAQLLINASSYTGTTGNFQSREFTADGPGTLLDMSALSSLTRSSGLGNTLTIRALNGGTLDMSSLSSFTDNVSGNGGLSVSAAGAESHVNLNNLQGLNDATVNLSANGTANLNTLNSLVNSRINMDKTAGADNLKLASSVYMDSDSVIDINDATNALIIGVTELPLVGGAVNVVNGELSGSGTILGDLHNAGIVEPGSSPGTLTVDGDYTQTIDGQLSIEIAELLTFDLLDISGSATLSGDLLVSLSGAYLPQLGDEFVILSALAGINGEFDNLFASSFNGLGFDIVYTDTLVKLTTVSAVPLPGSLILFISGFIFLLSWKKGST